MTRRWSLGLWASTALTAVGFTMMSVVATGAGAQGSDAPGVTDKATTTTAAPSP